MRSKPLVSVVTIFLNAEQLIQEAIESVCGQTYNNWELLLVDDGSTDGSTRIACQYSQRYPGKVYYLEHEGHKNLGMSISRNVGLRRATGEYITFLDSDDVWFSHTLARQVAILNSQAEAGMVYGATQWWYSWTDKPEHVQGDFIDFAEGRGAHPNTLFKPPALLTFFLENGGAVPCLCSVLARREVVEHVGGFEESFRGMYEDQVFYAKMCLAVPIFVTNECLARYRQHPDSCCAVAEQLGQSRSARVSFLNWLARYVSEQEIKDPQLWKALCTELWPYRHPILHRLSHWLKGV